MEKEIIAQIKEIILQKGMFIKNEEFKELLQNILDEIERYENVNIIRDLLFEAYRKEE